MPDEAGAQILEQLSRLQSQVGTVVSQMGNVSSDVKQVRAEIRALNGTVSEHDKWITIRTDREQQSDERGENRSGWFKVLVGAAFAFAAAILTMLVTILTAGVPH